MYQSFSPFMVELRGLEPLTSTLPVLRTSQLYYSPEHDYNNTVCHLFCQYFFLQIGALQNKTHQT